MIATVFKENSVTKGRKSLLEVKKNFCETGFVQDLKRASLRKGDVFDDVDDSYWTYEIRVRSIVAEHAPQEQKYPKKESPPFMNFEIRTEIYRKKCYLINLRKTQSREITENKGIMLQNLVNNQFNYISLNGVVGGKSQRTLGQPLNLSSA